MAQLHIQQQNHSMHDRWMGHIYQGLLYRNMVKLTLEKCLKIAFFYIYKWCSLTHAGTDNSQNCNPWVQISNI